MTPIGQHGTRGLYTTSLIGLSLLVVSGPSKTAVAGPFDVYGFGSRSMGMGGAMTAASDDYTGLYYNPAVLTLRKETVVGADFLAALPNLDVELDRAGSSLFPPDDVEPQGGVSVGLQYPLGGVAHHRLALGVALYVPATDDLIEAEWNDPRVPQWYRLDGLPRSLHFLAAIAGQPLDWLHLGLGLQSIAGVTGDAQLDLDLANQALPRREIEARFDTTSALVAGVLLNGPWGLRFGSTYRGPLQVDLQIPIAFTLADELGFVVGVAGVSLYTPAQWSWGVAADLRDTADLPLILSTDAIWARWSNAPEPRLGLEIDFGGQLLEDLALENQLDFEPPNETTIDFRDTLSLRLGAELQAAPSLFLHGGYAFRPGAIASSARDANYLDNDAHIGSFGVAFVVNNPLSANGSRLTLASAAQLTWLAEKRMGRPTADDPVGGYSARGNITAFTLTLASSFQ